MHTAVLPRNQTTPAQLIVDGENGQSGANAAEVVVGADVPGLETRQVKPAVEAMHVLGKKEMIKIAMSRCCAQLTVYGINGRHGPHAVEVVVVADVPDSGIKQ